MNVLITAATLVASFALQAGPAAETAPPTQLPAPQDFTTAVRAGKAALNSGDADGAIAAYEAAKAARPDSAEAAYNLGVALYRGGKFREAAASFKQAADLASNGERTDPALSSASLFNKAASFYGATRDQAAAAQQALEKAAAGDQADAAPPVDPEALKQAITDAKESLKSFKDAAFADGADLGSRANAEQASRLVRALEELQRQQQQQQQNDQQNDQQKQDEQNKDQNQDQQDQQGKDGEPQDKDQSQEQDKEQSGDQQQPKEGEQDKKEQKQQSGADQQKPPEQPPEEQPSKDQPQKDQGDGKQEDSKADAQPQPKDGSMTKDEADRLLQGVRDREQKRRVEQERRAEQQAKNARGRKPIKDW